MDLYSFNMQRQNGGKILVAVPVDGKNKYFYLEFRYNRIGEFWNMTLYDGNTQDIILSNVPLLYGEAPAQNILRQFGYMDIGSAFIVKLMKMPSTDSPDWSNWLEEFNLWWGSESA